MFSLNIKLLIFLNFFCVLSCVSKKTEYVDLLNSYSFPFVQKSSQDLFIKYDYIDINPYASSGLVWLPFILPQKKDEIIKESDLLVGYWNDLNDPILPPEKGSCRLVKDLDVDSSLKTPLRLVYFVSDNVNPKQDAGSLLFLLNPIDQSFFAIVRLNNDGQASCFISLKNFNVSIGFGQYRKEIQVNDSSLYIKVPFPETAYLNVDQNIEGVGFSAGDTLRIGRSIFETDHTILKNIETSGQYAIPAKIQKDLYISGNFTTKSMGVDEYIATSFLIEKKPFKIALEPGSYTFAILRKNKLLCLKKITLKEKQLINLSCSEIISYETDFEDVSKNYYFDTTIFPLHIAESAGFQSWLFASKRYFLLTNPNYYQDNFYNKEEGELKEFSLVYHSPSEKINYYLPNIYNFIKAMKIEKNQFRQIYEGLNPNNPSSTTEFLRNNPKNLLFFGIPVGGAGEQGIANYAVPFFNYTKISLSKMSQDFLKYANVQATNGAYIQLFEPLSNPTDESLLVSYAQQRFRFRITIPPWNSTSIVEMYLNGKLFRRWILDRGDVSKVYSKSFEESFSETKSFAVRWIAWGEEFLPDFLSGTKNSLPFSITRDYCIDNNGDGECHMEQKNG